MADPNDALIRQRIVDLLRSHACQRIDFRWGSYHVDGWCYLRVALAALSPLQDFHIAVDERVVDPGASALYSAQTNTLKISCSTYAIPADPQVAQPPFGLSSAAVLGFQRMTIVHECTHSAIDQMRQHPTILRRSNEVMAYVAGALFNINDGTPFDPNALPAAHPARPSFLAAHTIARNSASRPGTTIGTQIDVANLERALEATQLYHRRFHDQAIANNSGLRF
jgi:hypothetical protein